VSFWHRLGSREGYSGKGNSMCSSNYFEKSTTYMWVRDFSEPGREAARNEAGEDIYFTVRMDLI
jgi:hypothetical protein